MEDLGGAVSDDPVEPAAVVPPPAPPATAPIPEVPEGLPLHRPMIERLGMASIALVLAVLFGTVAAASWVGGELFLAVMAAIGALMTAWAGLITITRG
jgi:hypothetical protein